MRPPIFGARGERDTPEPRLRERGFSNAMAPTADAQPAVVAPTG